MMTRTYVGRALAAGVIALAAGACGESASGPDGQDLALVDQLVDAEVLAVVADGVAQDLDLMGGGFGVPGFTAGETLFLFGPEEGPRGPFAGAPDCPFDGTSYVCTRERMDDFSMSRTITFRNANGDPMEGYDPEDTESITLVVDLEGTRSGERITADIDRHHEKTVSGLAGEEETREWNGSGNDEVFRSMTNDAGESFSFDLEAETLSEQVIMPVPGRDEGPVWPLSGQISKRVEVVVTRPGEDPVTRSRDVLVTFNGTQFVTVLVNGEERTVDLAQRRQRRFQRQHGN